MKALVRVAAFCSLAVGHSICQASGDPVRWCENGHYYEAVSVPAGITWESARTEAESRGGYLATITSEGENNFIFGVVNNSAVWREQSPNAANYGPWLGGFQSEGAPEPRGGWQWVTGEPFTYSAWRFSEPNNNPEPGRGCNENRLHFLSGPNGSRTPTWNDVSDNPQCYGPPPGIVAGYVVEYDQRPNGTPCTTVWVERQTSIAPDAVEFGMMAFDSHRQRIVYFGGGNGCQNSGRTWEWDGTSWTLASSTGPAARRAAKMTYDSVRRVVVLFGGVGCFEHFADTWEWDGSSWLLRATSGPDQRREQGMAFDPIRARTVLFGGIGPSFPEKQDTWEWDGANWVLLSQQGPSRRVKPAMAFDSRSQTVILFGGQLDSAGTASGETWKWDGQNWNQVVASGPPPRWGAELVVDSVSGTAVLIGGTTSGNPFGTLLTDQWSWNGVSWDAISSATCFPPRFQFGAAFDSARGEIVVFGGSRQSGGVAPTTWTQASQTLLSRCDCIDFNRDSLFPTDRDLVEYLAVLAGGACPYSPLPNQACDIDFNNNGLFPEDQDLIDFLSVLAGGLCSE